MTRFHNTLYLSQPGTWVFKDGENLVVKRDKQTLAEVPVHHLIGVVCLGPINVTAEALGLCMKHGVGVSYLSFGGRFLGRVEGPASGNVLLRREQFALERDQDERRLAIVRGMIQGKVHNQAMLLKRTMRNHPQTRPELEPVVARLQHQVNLMADAAGIDQLRGFEGTASSHYFGVFDRLIRRSDFSFGQRSRRPPRNPVNAMLSFGYALLCSECASALQGVGLDPSVGFLHVLRPGRPSLALDLMEEFRALKVDRFVLSLINRGQCKMSDFTIYPNAAVTMTDTFRKTFLTRWQEFKKEPAFHGELKSGVDWGLLPHLQARLLARVVRGDLETYPAYRWRT